MSSRLLEYEIWAPLHARGLEDSHGRGGAPACRTDRAAGVDPAGSGAGAGCLSRSGSAAGPRRPASGIVRVSGRSGSESGTRELRPADERRRPRDGYPALRSGRAKSGVTGEFLGADIPGESADHRESGCLGSPSGPTGCVQTPWISIRVSRASEICRIPRVQRKTVGQGRSADQQIGKAPADAAASLSRHRVHATVGPGDVRVAGQRIPFRTRPLQTVLPSPSFVGPMGRVRAGGQFRQGDGRNRRDLR